MRRRILVISYSDLGRDARVNRQMRFLMDDFEVVCAGLGDPRLPGVRFIPLFLETALGLRGIPRFTLRAFRLYTGRYEQYYWNTPWIKDAVQKLSGTGADLVIANDVNTLPLALRVAGSAPVVFDAHEYAPLEYEESLVFRLFFQGLCLHICRQYIPRTAGMMTVCQGIADRYKQEFGANPVVVTNAPDYEALEPRTPNPGRIRLLHHGAGAPTRNIEGMLDVMKHLDERFHLTFMLVESTPGYIQRLKQRAAGDPRIEFRDPVPMRELTRVTNEYDVGLYILRPVNFNNKHALPNKFFEFIQGRLALAIGPSPEMAALVKEHNLGLVAPDFESASLAKLLNAMTHEDLVRYKANAHRTAELLSAETNRHRLRDLISQVLRSRQVVGEVSV